MKKFGKNKIMATFLLSAFTVGLENVESEAFSQKYLISNNGFLDRNQFNEIYNMGENGVALKKYVKAFEKYIVINKNISEYKNVVLLTLAGMRAENNNEWKMILRALRKTDKKLKIQFSDDFEKSNQTAYSTTTISGNPVIIFNKNYFISNNALININEFQKTLCHEIGHIWIESTRINQDQTNCWDFDDRYIADLIEPKKRTAEAILFIDEYSKYKKAHKNGKLRGCKNSIYSDSGFNFSMYGIKSHDDTEMLADTMKDYLINNSKEPAIFKNIRIKCISYIASQRAKQKLSNKSKLSSNNNKNIHYKKLNNTYKSHSLKRWTI